MVEVGSRGETNGMTDGMSALRRRWGTILGAPVLNPQWGATTRLRPPPRRRRNTSIHHHPFLLVHRLFNLTPPWTLDTKPLRPPSGDSPLRHITIIDPPTLTTTLQVDQRNLICTSAIQATARRPQPGTSRTARLVETEAALRRAAARESARGRVALLRWRGEVALPRLVHLSRRRLPPPRAQGRAAARRREAGACATSWRRDGSEVRRRGCRISRVSRRGSRRRRREDQEDGEGVMSRARQVEPTALQRSRVRGSGHISNTSAPTPTSTHRPRAPLHLRSHLPTPPLPLQPQTHPSTSPPS